MFINAREAVPKRKMMIDMGHPQPCTTTQKDNLEVHLVVTKIVQPRRTKAMDMGLNWLRFRAAQRQFRYYWRPGLHNLADYITKHHTGSHQRNVRHEYLTPLAHLEAYRMSQKQGLKDTWVSRTKSSLATPRLLARTQAILKDIRFRSKVVLDLVVGTITHMGRENQIPSQWYCSTDIPSGAESETSY